MSERRISEVTLIEEAQQFALGQALSDWGDLTYDEVLDALENYDENREKIFIAYDHEDDDDGYVAETIVDDFHAVLRLLKKVTQ